MREAIRQAEQAEKAGEVPVGAVVTRDDRILAAGYNRTVGLNDPTAHAELIVLRAAAAELATARISDCTLYVTVEPCLMCVGAIVHSRIKRLVYGAREPRTGAVASAFDVLMSDRHNHRVAITESVLEHDCRQLMQRFFAARR